MATRPGRPLVQGVVLAAALLFAALAGLLVFLFVDLYWQHRGTFDSAGRLFIETDGVVLHEQAVWLALPALACAAVSAALARAWHRGRTGRQRRGG